MIELLSKTVKILDVVTQVNRMKIELEELTSEMGNEEDLGKFLPKLRKLIATMQRSERMLTRLYEEAKLLGR